MLDRNEVRMWRSIALQSLPTRYLFLSLEPVNHPSRHFVSFSQVIIYRGGGLDAVWRNFGMVAMIGLAFFSYSVVLFRKSIAATK